MPAGTILQSRRWPSELQRTSSKPKNGRAMTPGNRSALRVASVPDPQAGFAALVGVEGHALVPSGDQTAAQLELFGPPSGMRLAGHRVGHRRLHSGVALGERKARRRVLMRGPGNRIDGLDRVGHPLAVGREGDRRAAVVLRARRPRPRGQRLARACGRSAESREQSPGHRAWRGRRRATAAQDGFASCSSSSLRRGRASVRIGFGRHDLEHHERVLGFSGIRVNHHGGAGSRSPSAARSVRLRSRPFRSTARGPSVTSPSPGRRGRPPSRRASDRGAPRGRQGVGSRNRARSAAG